MKSIFYKNMVEKYKIENDIFLLDKPVGPTSFSFINYVKNKLGFKKIGHGGTLDPLASGLMIVGVDKGTKKLGNYIKLNKTYVAEILIGKKTETGDLEGKILEEKKIDSSDFDDKKINFVLDKIKGKNLIKVPLYSAIKVQGMPLYKYARNGIKPPYIPEKEMDILSIKLLNKLKKEKFLILKIEIEVSSGSYIRAIAEKIGKEFGYPATLKNLIRTKIDNYNLDDALVLY